MRALSFALLVAAAPLAAAQGSNPFALGADVSFNPSGGPAALAHELTHVVQQSGGVQRRIVGSRPLPATGAQQAFTYDAGVFRTLSAPNAFETIAKAADFNGRIFGAVRRTTGWLPYFWQGTVGDTFGGPAGYSAEFALPQGGVVALPVDSAGNLQPLLSSPIGTWRPFEAPNTDHLNATLDYMWLPSVTPSADQTPVFFGTRRMRSRPEILFQAWDNTIAEYVPSLVTPPFPSDAKVTAVGVVSNGAAVVARVERPGTPPQTLIIDRATGDRSPLTPPPGYATASAYGVQKGTGAVVCQCNHLLRGTSDLFIYEPDTTGAYTRVRNIPLIGSISVGFSVAPPAGPTGKLFSQIRPDFVLPATDPNGLPTSIVFKALYCPTDLDADDKTTTSDLALFLAQFGRAPTPADRDPDYNNDAQVNTADLVILLAGFGCQPPQ